MLTVGLRELRQDASDLVRRVQAGEEVEITVSGRPAARLVPVAPRQWLSWSEVSEVLSGPPDGAWDVDRGLLDEGLRDPWADRS